MLHPQPAAASHLPAAAQHAVRELSIPKDLFLLQRCSRVKDISSWMTFPWKLVQAC